ncbi:ras-associated and pleckstrin homology domains-containing protein 1-like [Drosophila ananassae]|uniref:ras-associated and pleckstrin homology domains-containing protein 1-like n=1 Tax=Drosophila ananassae TaxID=7217 RepID=UPI0013A5D425|nr:ras-associated and pleckstrin homology domains-containing protein 1-like [Drosophila ananassae]
MGSIIADNLQHLIAISNKVVAAAAWIVPGPGPSKDPSGSVSIGMSNRKVLPWMLPRQMLQLLLLPLICSQLPGVIADPSPCPPGQYYVNGECAATNSANNTVACPNAPLPPTIVSPVTPPPCPNAPLPPTMVAPATPPPCPNAPMAPSVVPPAAPPLQPAPLLPPYYPTCITNCQTACTGAYPGLCPSPCFSNSSPTNCPPSYPSSCPNNCPTNCPSNPSACPNNCPSNCPNTCGNNNNNCNGNNNCNNNCQNRTPPTVVDPTPPTNPTYPTPCPVYPTPPTPNPIYPTPPTNPICPTPPTNPIYPTPPTNPICPTPPTYPTYPIPPTYPTYPTPTTPPTYPTYPTPTTSPTRNPNPTPPNYPPPADTTSLRPSTYPPPPPTPTTTEPPTYAPPAITRCPDGTILIRGRCRLIYCGGYGVYKDGQCVRPRCPAGYVWTENRCSKPQPNELGTIHLTSTIYQQGDDHPKLVTNNVNNLKVNASIAIQGQASEEELEVLVEVPPPPQPPTGPCCNVVTPRICSTPADQSAARYKCYSRSHQQCGSFCSASRVVLVPAMVTTWQMPNAQLITMPPTWGAQGCQFSGGSCQPPQNHYDCSGCAAGDFATCSSYCYSYKCPSHNCVYYDQAQFCAQYPDQIGCRVEDGWGL